MKSDRSSALRDAKEIEPTKGQQITPSFLDILDVILTSIHESVVVLNADLKVMRANHAFYRTLQVNADAVEGVRIYDLDNGQWDIPRLRELLENIHPESPKYDDFEVEHKFGTLGHKILHLNASWIFSDHGDPKARLELDIDKADWILQRLPELGISIDKVTQQLEDEGVGKFNEPFDKLMKALTKKSLPATEQPSAG
jgi:PAS domain-containing protein